MKKILSVLICVVLGFSSMYGARKLTITSQVYVYQNEGGQVLANTSTTPSSGWADYYVNTLTVNNNPATSSSNFGYNTKCVWTNYSLYYHAKADSEYAFVGWSKDENNSVDDSKTAKMD